MWVSVTVNICLATFQVDIIKLKSIQSAENR